MLYSVVFLAAAMNGFLILLFIKYKQGKLIRNPFKTILIKEGSILFYAFFRWKRKKNKPAESFCLHKNSGYFFLFLALLHEQVIEMVIFHIYLHHEDPAFAYIFTALHLYSILYMLGDYNWMRNSPVRLNHNRVEMKIGARRELVFNLEDIATIDKASIQYRKSGEMIHEKQVFHATGFPRILTLIFGMSDPLKYEIVFHEPQQAIGYFGTKKTVTKALLYLDQSDGLVRLLQTQRAGLGNKAGGTSVS
ncbi:hypothetical protein [Metabacillus sp. 84]|uniref:hypothetical protein n=1 Tax=Metabacillus sp. 84 TaxID=3404705 RepID=UPI003CF4544E